jgi:tRNA pseudouridine13 synthase
VPDALALAVALDPPRAHGFPVGRARMRVAPEDFVVEEELGFEPDGNGPHLLLKVRKRAANTVWIARQLARLAGCPVRDVGYAGLKDRHALATQWFTVPASTRRLDWQSFTTEEFSILEAHPHRRKLPRGALAANFFRIRFRSVDADRLALRERLERVRASGVPNYFGPQRFGRDGANLEYGRALAAVSRQERAFVLSAARSLVFNAVLAERVSDATWCRLEPGDVANLDARGSTFGVEQLEATLVERAARLEIHPTGPLWGVGEPATLGSVRARELACAASFAAASGLVASAGMRQERRSLRVAVRNLEYDLDGDPVIGFRLTRGAFATSVVRELLDCADPESGEAQSA